MKFIDLKPLSIARLKAYRKSVLSQISALTHCDCGSSGCDYPQHLLRFNENYKNLCVVRDRINKELARKQKLERESKENPAEVPAYRKGKMIWP